MLQLLSLYVGALVFCLSKLMLPALCLPSPLPPFITPLPQEKSLSNHAFDSTASCRFCMEMHGLDPCNAMQGAPRLPP